ncbi:MAG: alanine racemase [Aeromicrobium sp.]
MSFTLHVDAARWRAGIRRVVDATPELVPVIKGNGYGFGRDLLAREAVALGLDTIAVGTYAEVPAALASFTGDIMVLTPWRPFLSEVVLEDRVVHTVGRVEDIVALAHLAPGARIVLEGETSMSRHGLDRHELAAAVAALGDLEVVGFAIHLPLIGAGPAEGHLREAESWAAALAASQLETTTLFVSHLTPTEIGQLSSRRPHLTIRPRICTAVWLGDLGALSVRAEVLDRHTVGRGERVGYRQRAISRDGVLLVVAGGTSHGVGLEAPRAASGVLNRGKTLAKGGLEAAGLALSPFTIAGKQRWFAEPPHMHVSLVLVPADVEAPAIGDTVDVAVRYTTTTFDRIELR